jgi:carboxyl-terminal processing protease
LPWTEWLVLCLIRVKTNNEGPRGHLKTQEGEERTGSQSYIPLDVKNDKALNMALELLRGTKTNPTFPPNTKTAQAPSPQ